jgi:hypothetical protein
LSDNLKDFRLEQKSNGELKCGNKKNEAGSSK